MVPLVGRGQELGRIGLLIDGVHVGGSALLVRGEAGIGKSAIVAAAASRAKECGFRVLTTTGVQSETELTFAGLHQLLRPLLDSLITLPIPQRNALGSAFGLVDAGVPNCF
jgi:predicted ATPase